MQVLNINFCDLFQSMSFVSIKLIVTFSHLLGIVMEDYEILYIWGTSNFLELNVTCT
jgi:hypothetical protein